MDRKKVVQYASDFWDKPCRDGRVDVSRKAVFPGTKRGRGPINIESERQRLSAPKRDGWEAVFVQNTGFGVPEELRFVRPGAQSQLIQDSGLDDCVHFVSKCLQEGGGLNQEIQWVPTLVDVLSGRSDTKKVAEKVTHEEGQRIIATEVLDEGDVIAYYYPEPNPTTGNPGYTHSAIYLGRGQIACHTNSRFKDNRHYSVAEPTGDEGWKLNKGSYKYTFIHYREPAEASALAASGLAGWWQVTFRATNYYYYFFNDGRVRYTDVKPRSLSLQPASTGGNSGYWFDRTQPGPHLLIIWRIGEVEKFGFAGFMDWRSLRTLPGIWNDTEPMRATKM